MATDCLEDNSMHQTPSVDGEEVNTNPLISIDENLSNIEVSKPKTVHQFYFAKIRPYNDPDEASRIAEAEKQIEKLTSDLVELKKRFRVLMLEWRDGWSKQQELQRRQGGISGGMESKKIVLDQLLVALNKLNILCQERGAGLKSTLSVEPKSRPRRRLKCRTRMPHGSSNNFVTERKLLRQITTSQEITKEYRQGLKCRMRMPHGSSNNLVTERKLLRQITTSQEKTKEYGLVRAIGWYILGGKPMLEKIKQIEQRKEKALADAFAIGDTWDPFTAKRAIQEQIKLLNKVLEESRRELCEVQVELERVKKIIKTIEEKGQISVVMQQLSLLSCQKRGVQYWIFRRPSWMMDKYKENMMMYMNHAKQLARKKDVESLRKLSHQQLKKFMLEWNQSFQLRTGYEVTIQKSLEERGLSKDGRIKSIDDET